MAKTAKKATAKKDYTGQKKEITKLLMLSPLFGGLNSREKKTIITELSEKIGELEDELRKLRTLETDDKRTHPRKKVRTIVEYATPDKFFHDCAHNVSKGGMFIASRKPLGVGTNITLTFTIPKSDIPIKVRGKVIWIAEKGMGLKFREVDESTKRKIKSILSET